jgi:hypothetical protein
MEAGPYGITQFDAAGVIGNYQRSQANRIQMMLAQKELEAQQKQEQKQEGVQKAVSAYLGGQKEADAPAPAAAPSPVAGLRSAASAVPAAYGAAPQTQPSPAASGQPPAAPPSGPDNADREKLFSTLLAIDPQVASQYMDAFAKMDGTQARQFAQKNDHIIQLMGGLAQLPAEQRKAAIQQEAPQLQQLGYTQEQIASFDPSDDNLRSEMAKHMDAQKVAEFVKPDLMTVKDSVIDKNHPERGAVYTAPADYKQFSVHNADGSETPYAFDGSNGSAFQLRDSGGPATGDGSAPGGFEHAVETVLGNEGGYAPSDMNGKPVNFGINQGANPDVDVKNLTRDQAKQLYHDRYWVPSGAERPARQSPDALFRRVYPQPGMAKKALKDSGGDPQKFMAISSGYFQKLAQKPSGQKYAKAWAARDANNMAIARGGGGIGAPISGKPLSHDPGDDDTAKFIGGQVALGQPMPPLGMGKEAAAMRRSILAEATKQWKQMGISPGEANVIAAQNKSGLAELAKIAQMKATVQTAENTASSNATQVLSLLGSAGTSGSPIFNQWQQAGRRATGDSKVSAFDVAVKTLATEYARVMSGGNSQQLSDSARHEADALIHTSMTPDQFRSAIHQMKIDMANRTQGIEQERQHTLDQIRTGGRGGDGEWQTTKSGIKYRKVG